MATAADVMDYLRGNRTEFKILTHPPYASKRDMASSKGIPPEEVADVLTLRADKWFVMTVIPAGRKVSEQTLCDLLQAKELSDVSEWDLERLFPTCEIKSVAPFGHLFGVPVVADASFERIGRIVFPACSRTISLMMEWRDYQRLVHPTVAEIVEVDQVARAVAAQGG